MAFNHKHLIDITEYSEEDIKLILETAKAFCGAEAPGFVNGVLGAILREVRQNGGAHAA